jgi:hypothetical protein
MLLEINDFKSPRLILNIDDAIAMQAALSSMIGNYIKTINNRNIEPCHIFPTAISTNDRLAPSKITFFIEK